MTIKVRVALVSQDGTVLAQDPNPFDPTTSDGPDAAVRVSTWLRGEWRHVTDDERAGFSRAVAALAALGARDAVNVQDDIDLNNEAAEIWKLAGVFGRVNCPHGCKQVAADEECPHGYPSLAKRMGVKF